jgi:putative membrane protein
MSTPFFPILHAGGAYPTGWLHSDWRPEPTVILGVFALIAAYLWWTGPKNRAANGELINPVSRGQRVAFVAGSLVMLIALNPPLDDWSDSYLLSAHMSQHLLLMFVTAPLWLIGMPAWLLRRLVAPRLVNQIGYALTRPVVAFVVSSAVVTVWHMPFAYDAALRHEPVHIIQHLSFLVAAVIAWWPVVGPLPEWPRLSPPLQCLYLFASTIPGGIVGAFVTLAEPGLYTPYRGSPRIFGMSLATDQEIAGLLMWVLTSVIYLLVITVVFFRWAAAEDAKEGYKANRPGAPLPEAASRLDSSTSSLPS